MILNFGQLSKCVRHLNDDILYMHTYIITLSHEQSAADNRWT